MMAPIIESLWRKFGKGFNPGESEPFENLFLNQSKKHFKSRSMQIGWKSIWLNPVTPEILIRMNEKFNLDQAEDWAEVCDLGVMIFFPSYNL